MVQIIKSKIKKVNNPKLKKKKIGGFNESKETVEKFFINSEQLQSDLHVNYYLFILMYYYSQNKLNTKKNIEIIKKLINELTDLCGKTPDNIFSTFANLFKNQKNDIKQNDYILIKESNVYILYVKYHNQWYKIDGSITEINDLPKDINPEKIIIQSIFPPRNNSLDYDLTIHTFPYKKPRLFIDDTNNVIYYILQYLFLNKEHVNNISNIHSRNIISIINNKELDISFDDILYFRENMMYNLTYQNDNELLIDDIDKIDKYKVIDTFSKKKNQYSILDSNYLTIQKKEKNIFQKKLCLTNEDTSIKLLCDKFIYFDKDLIPNHMSGGQKKSLLNPKIIQAENGNNQCWLNAPLYAIAAHMDIFKNLHDNVISITKKIDRTREIYKNNDIESCSDKFGTEYENLYNYILDKSSNNKWNKDTYDGLIELIKKTTDNKANYDIPNNGGLGNAQEFIQPLIFSVLKYCKIGDFIEIDNLQIGENIINNLLKKSVVIKDPPRTINYELISILKPTRTVGYSNQGAIVKNVSHWTCYVKKSNNKFLKFDAADGGTIDTEIEFKDIFKFTKDTENKVYNCTFLYLNPKYLYENNTENNTNKEIPEIKNVVKKNNFKDYYKKLFTYDNQEKKKNTI